MTTTPIAAPVDPAGLTELEARGADVIRAVRDAQPLAKSVGRGIAVWVYPSRVIAFPHRDLAPGEVTFHDVSRDPRSKVPLAHGHRTLYRRGCPCTPCLDAHRSYLKKRELAVLRDPHAHRVPAGPVAERIEHLRRTMTPSAIAAASGLPHSIINRVAGQKEVSRATAEKVMRVRLGDLTGPHLIDATGSRRRLQALATMGWTRSMLAPRVGITVANLAVIIDGSQEQVRTDTAASIRAVYDALWRTPAPRPQERNARSGHTRALAHAAAQGWATPLAWDEDTIDDPDAIPEGMGYRAPLEVDVEEVGALLEAGTPADDIIARLGFTRKAIRTALTRAGRARQSDAFLIGR